MKEFLYWSEVQRKLNEHAMCCGIPYSFYDAVLELWTKREFHKAKELPSVAFAEWDVEDLDAFDRLMEQTPVDLNIFKESFVQKHSATKAQEQLVAMDMIPARQALNHVQGIHQHNSFEMIYAMRGCAVLQYEGGNRTLPQGTFCLVSPKFMHDVSIDWDCQLISIPFTSQSIEAVLHNLLWQDNAMMSFLRSGLEGKLSGFQIFSAADELSVRNIIRNIFHECYAHEAYSQQIQSNYIGILFAQMLRQCGHTIEQYGEHRKQEGQPSVQVVLKYIESNYRTSSLNEIAKHFHYEPSYLGRLIKAGTGKKYTDIVRSLRLDEAKRLLCTTDLSVEEVAEKAGYGSTVQMFRIFRSVEEITPGEYRKRFLGRNRKISR